MSLMLPEEPSAQSGTHLHAMRSKFLKGFTCVAFVPPIQIGEINVLFRRCQNVSEGISSDTSAVEHSK